MASYSVRINSWCEFEDKVYEGGEKLELTDDQALERQLLVYPDDPPVEPTADTAIPTKSTTTKK